MHLRRRRGASPCGERTCPEAGLSPALGAQRPPLSTQRQHTMTTHVSDANFGEEVLNSKEPVLVDFWAEWCGPCRAISPLLEELSTELAGKVKIVKLNVDENPGTTVKYGVRSIPTMILYTDGAPVDMKIGAGTPKAGLPKSLN